MSIKLDQCSAKIQGLINKLRRYCLTDALLFKQTLFMFTDQYTFYKAGQVQTKQVKYEKVKNLTYSFSSNVQNIFEASHFTVLLSPAHNICGACTILS